MLRAAILGGGLFLASAGAALAAGYGIFTQGARALGRADASIAQLDAPSALFFNPALITRLTGTQIEAGTTAVLPQRRFTSAAGGPGAETGDSAYFPSTLYLTHGRGDLSFGLALFNPFGLGTEWPDDWEGRTLATRSQIVTYNLNPSLAWKIGERLSVAGGISWVRLDAELERRLNFSALGAPDGTQLFEGDGDGWGFNLGVAWVPAERWSVGLSYRSAVEIEVAATTTFGSVPAALTPLFPPTPAATALILPQQLFAGVAWQVTDALLLETSLRWEDWRSFDQLRIRLAQPVGPLGQTEETQVRDWHDTLSISLGGEYRLAPATILLFGYLYGEDAVPDATFEPAIPDSPSHLVCLGLAQRFGAWSVDLAYGFQHLEDRDKNNATPANGTYASDLHLIGLSVTRRF